MSLKSPGKVLLGGMVLVALLSVSLFGCATSGAPASSPTPMPAPAPVPAPSPAPAPAAKPASMPAPASPQTAEMKLTVTQPVDNSIFDTSTVEIQGMTTPGAVVSANSEFATADSQGNFSVAVLLDEGPNIIEVFASDDSGNQANLTLTVSYIK